MAALSDGRGALVSSVLPAPLFLCATHPSSPAAGKILQGPAETSSPSGSLAGGPPASVTTSLMHMSTWFLPLSALSTRGRPHWPLLGLPNWTAGTSFVHSANVCQALRGCPTRPCAGAWGCSHKGAQRPRPQREIRCRGIQYSDKGRNICGPNSLSRSLLLGEGRVQQGLRAEVMSFVSASGRGRDSKSFPDR